MTVILCMVSLLFKLIFSRHKKWEWKLEKKAQKIILSQNIDDFSLWLNPHVRSKEDFFNIFYKAYLHLELFSRQNK